MDAIQANKQFYDLTAEIYDLADGRRSSIPDWLVDAISFCEEGHDKTFLDLGAGTGFISKIAAHYYDQVWAADISEKMLAQIPDELDIQKIPCDITKPWPFAKDRFFDKIACVSTLHHIPDLNALAVKIWDNLTEGGIFYTDLDIDKEFVRRWRIPLTIYRKIRRAAERFINLCPEVTEELYNCAEVHADGVDLSWMIAFFQAAGFLVNVRYHWGNNIPFPRGFAPFVSLWVVR